MHLIFALFNTHCGFPAYIRMIHIMSFMETFSLQLILKIYDEKEIHCFSTRLTEAHVTYLTLNLTVIHHDQQLIIFSVHKSFRFPSIQINYILFLKK